MGYPRCNACDNNRLKRELGAKYLLIGNTVYELDASPVRGQGELKEHNGRPIRFRVWFMAIEHSGELSTCPRLDGSI